MPTWAWFLISWAAAWLITGLALAIVDVIRIKRWQAAHSWVSVDRAIRAACDTEKTRQASKIVSQPKQ